MTQSKFKEQMALIRQKAKVCVAMAEAIDSTTSPTIHNLWKSTGELHGMVNALKSEAAGNDAPKVGG